MDHLDTLRAFVAIADLQGFAAAARRLGVSPPAVTRAIGALEKRLGVVLLLRSTRTVSAASRSSRFVRSKPASSGSLIGETRA